MLLSPYFSRAKVGDAQNEVVCRILPGKAAHHEISISGLYPTVQGSAKSRSKKYLYVPMFAGANGKQRNTGTE